jgi:hypothetical protein
MQNVIRRMPLILAAFIIAACGTADDGTRDTQMDEPSPGREVIGSWHDARPYGVPRITIYRENSQTYVDYVFDENTRTKMPATEVQAPDGRHFVKVEPDATGDHWVLTPDGNLQLRDDQGLIAIARPAN